MANGGWGKASRAKLPRPSVPLVSRDRELSQIVDLVTRPEPRLVTLVGPPGAGKTLLAVMTADAVVGQFADGVWSWCSSWRRG